MSDEEKKFTFSTPDFGSLRITGSDVGDDRPRRSTRSGVSSLTGASTVFDTAVESDSAVTGGESLSSALKMVGLKFVEDSSLLCRATMPTSQGNRVCVKPRAECKSANHVGRNELEDYCFYVSPRKDQVLIANSLPKVFLSDEEIQKIVSTKQTVELWFSYFDRVKDTEAWESVGTPTSQVTLEQAVKGQADLTSPKKVRLSELIEHLTDVDTTIGDMLRNPKELHRLTEFVEKKGAVPLSLEDVVAKLVESWDKIQGNFDVLEQQEKEARTELVHLKEALEEISKSTEDKFDLIDSKAHIILSLIGNDDVASDHGEKSIWTAIRGLIKDFETLRSNLQSNIIDLETRFWTRWDKADDRLKNQGKKIKENTSYLNAFKQEFETQLAKMYAAMSDIVDDVKALSPGGRRPDHEGVKAQISELEARLEGDIRKLSVDLTSQIRSLEAKIPSSAGRSGSPSVRFQTVGSALGDMRSRASEWAGGYGDFSTLGEETHYKSSLDDLRARSGGGPPDDEQMRQMEEDINRLKDYVGELQQRIKGEGYTSLQFHFNSREEAMEFLERTGFDVGWMWDIYSALVAAVQKRLDGKELSDWRHAALKTKTSKRQNQLESTFASGRPKILFGDNDGEPQPLKDGMGNIKSYAIWGSGHEPFKNTVTKKLNTFIGGVKGDLPKKEKDPDKLEGISLALSLLNEVTNQWSALSAYIDSAYNDLTQQANFSPKQAWLLVGRYAAAVFEAMSSVRDSARSLDDPTTLDSRTTIFWAVLQCHRIMQEFVDEDFKGHPLIVKETSFYTLIDRVSEEDLETLKRKTDHELEFARKRIKLLEEDQHKKANTIQDLHSKYSTLMNQYTQLKDKVTALDKKVK